MLLVLNTPEVVPTTCMPVEVSLPSHKPGTQERSALGCFPRSLHSNQTCKEPKCSACANDVHANGVKPSDQIAKLFNKNCACFTSQVKTGEVIGTSMPYRSARSCRKCSHRCEVAGSCQPLPALVSTQWDFCEVKVLQVRKSQSLQVQQVKPQDQPARHQKFVQSQV